MQFIEYDSDDSENNPPPDIHSAVKPKGEPNATNVVSCPAVNQWTVQESSSEDSDSEEPEESLEDVESKKGGLIDVEQLFATISAKPKFLNTGMDEVFKVGAIKQHNYDTTSSISTGKSDHRKEKLVTQLGGKGKVLKVGTSSMASKPAEVSAADLALKKTLDDRESAKVRLGTQYVLCTVNSKFMLPHVFWLPSCFLCVAFLLVGSLCFVFLFPQDRVKRQRLNGQSGVGSDFREWRSEEEMRQRQMFD